MCSTCLATEFDCGWCDTISDDTCRVHEDCSSGNFSTQSNQCPSPTISSFSPTSGPQEGGTRIQIRGTNLGVSYSDISSSVTVGGVPCPTNESGYTPGLVITCETGVFSSVGNVNVSVTLAHQSGVVTASLGPFTVTTATITGVSPEQGPQSGGTLITIQGTNLNIGNTEDTTITIRDVPCIVQ